MPSYFITNSFIIFQISLLIFLPNFSLPSFPLAFFRSLGNFLSHFFNVFLVPFGLITIKEGIKPVPAEKSPKHGDQRSENYEMDKEFEWLASVLKTNRKLFCEGQKLKDSSFPII